MSAQQCIESTWTAYLRGERLMVAASWSPLDPVAVRLTFLMPGQEPQTWAVSRDLLIAGLHGSQGVGDVLVMPGEAVVTIALRSAEDGSLANVVMRRLDLAAFLSVTLIRCPLGEERYDVNGCIELLLAGA